MEGLRSNSRAICLQGDSRQIDIENSLLKKDKAFKELLKVKK